MTRRFEFHPEARRELRDSVVFYEAEAPGIGREFAATVRRSVDLVLEFPLSGAPFEAGTRRRLLGRFPYTLVYLHDDAVVTVVAVMHNRREPGYWHSRLG